LKREFGLSDPSKEKRKTGKKEKRKEKKTEE